MQQVEIPIGLLVFGSLLIGFLIGAICGGMACSAKGSRRSRYDD